MDTNPSKSDAGATWNRFLWGPENKRFWGEGRHALASTIPDPGALPAAPQVAPLQFSESRRGHWETEVLDFWISESQNLLNWGSQMQRSGDPETLRVGNPDSGHRVGYLSRPGPEVRRISYPPYCLFVGIPIEPIDCYEPC